MRSRSSFRSTTALALPLALLGLAGCSPATPSPTASAAPSGSAMPTAIPSPEADAELAALEMEYDARLGVYAIDTGTGEELRWNADDRFAFASTVKALAAGAVLDEVGVEGIDEFVTITADDLVDFSPITETRVGTGMTLREIADAAVRYSDNTAGNLLFEALGGPAEFDAALEELGDDVTESVRTETELNTAVPGDTRDTSTPEALAGDLREYVLGETLEDDERALLIEWLRGNTTGDELIRAQLPSDWVIGDKTGAGGYGTRNDIGVIWPTDGEPIVIAVLSDRGVENADYDNGLIADAAAVAVAALRSEETRSGR